MILNIFRIYSSIFFFLILTSTVMAQSQVQKEQEELRMLMYRASDQGKYELYEQFMLEGAEKGWKDFQRDYGLYLLKNKPEKGDEAVEWLRKAAAQKDSEALHKLGLIYYSGEIVTKSLDKAVHYIKHSAELGNIEALTDMGKIYLEGKVVPKSTDKAIEYLEKAALSRRASEPNYILASLYYNGEGVNVDYEKAANYLMFPLKNYSYTSKTAHYLLADHHFRNKNYKIAADLFGQMYHQQTKSNEEVLPDLLKVAQEGDDQMYLNLYDLYDNEDEDKALQFLKKAIDRKYEPAYYYYATELESDEKLKEAFKYYQKAADYGDPVAMDQLGEFYSQGKGVEKDLHKAFQWYRKGFRNSSLIGVFDNDRFETFFPVFYPSDHVGWKYYTDDAKRLKRYYNESSILRKKSDLGNLVMVFEKIGENEFETWYINCDKNEYLGSKGWTPIPSNTTLSELKSRVCK